MPESLQPARANLSQRRDVFFCWNHIWDKIYDATNFLLNNRAAMMVRHLLKLETRSDVRMETGTAHSVSYPRVCHAHRFRITLVIGLILLALVFAEASAYLQNTRFFKISDHTENDLAEYEYIERPADLWIQKTSHNFSGTPARISLAASRQAFFTHLLDQGKQQMQRQDFIRALNTFERALALGWGDPALYYLMADLHRALGRYALSDQFREVGDARTIRPNPVSGDAVANAEPGEAATTTRVMIEMSAQPAADRISLDGSNPN